jgi:hypothetical protein
VKRCPSCEHGLDIHDADGRCWFTVASGLPETNLVCPCKVTPPLSVPSEKGQDQ